MVSYAESAMELRNWLNFVAYALVVSNIFVAVAQLQLLPQHEVETLEAIFVKLNFKHGKISRSFCSSSEAENVTETIPIKILINITCSCSGTVCHVTNIKMKTKNLFGALPTEFANLSQLTEIELTRNYINGGIPPAFIKLPLTILSLSENPIGGLIPETIGDIGTLEELVLECANLSGLLPPNLGSLNGLRRLVLSSNNFTGTIPDTFGKLKNLTEFRIQGSGLHGKIPSLIGNWTKITILDMQGTSMEGPIPDSLSQLKDLEELAISDLTGSATTTKFPNLRDMKNLEKLVLRNCNIAAPIPDYIGELQYLMLLDLSFNLLAGRIPALLPTGKLKNMFLNGNSLYGTLPDWVSSSNFYLDISYNNFIVTSSITCSQPKLNAVAITSSIQKNSKLEWCLKKDLPCSTKPKYYSLFINCGGDKVVNFNGNEYEADSSNEGQASFYYAPSEKWAYSSTGVSMYEDSPAYRAQNTFSLNITGPDYYQTARVAPSSLKYYGLCLLKGSYKVRLHFAEIMFSNDQTFSSLGNRIFDVSIQGKPVLENFNIAEEAGGVGKAIDKEFHADVNGSTLEIHLYWSGKGSTSVPQEGVHGPLISAISVTMVNPPTSGLSLGVIIGIVACSCVFLVFVLFVLRMKGYLGGKDPEDTAATRHIFEHNMADENQEEDLQLRLFNLAAITNATDNFSINNMLGEGGFGPVYKGVLEGGQEIAVKRLSSHSTQGLEEFKNEVICIAKLQHWNLVKLLGYCVEREEKMLIYEYMSNKSLDLFIFDETRTTLLNWPQRFNIINGISRGILYLHQDSRVIIIHRDLKASNVLLDIDMNPKIADFGMARSFGRNVMEAQTGRVVGTFGYMSPEYQVDGIFSVRSDVFSFGVLVLEIVSGKKNRGFYHPDHNHNLLGHAWMLYNEGRSLELIDATAIDDNSRYLSEMMRSIHVALLCVQRYPEDRPSMSSVVLMLSSDVELPQPKEPGFFTERNPVEVESSTSRDACSPNGVTITLLDAR